MDCPQAHRLRKIPRVDEAVVSFTRLLENCNNELKHELFEIAPPLITKLVRKHIDQYRQELLQDESPHDLADTQEQTLIKLHDLLELEIQKRFLRQLSFPECYQILKQSLNCSFDSCIHQHPELFYQSLRSYFKLSSPSLQRVINVSGVVLHTNLGRAPLSEDAQQALNAAARYCTIEFDLETAQRGHRLDHVEELLCHLSGAEAACVVNNNAAAVILVLSCFSLGKEALISRGELVEIGGSFRIPDIMKLSGALMKEVGTTNKTHYRDYEAACTEQTALILKVHPSNYQIQGFTQAVSCKDLKELCRVNELLLYEDQGSGALVNLEDFNLVHERTVCEALADGVDLVSCSGDKLLGSTQAGIIFGKKNLIEQLKRHPLMRALRMDKLCLAALEASLKLYLNQATLSKKLPLLQMIELSEQDMKRRAKQLIGLMDEASEGKLDELCQLEIKSVHSLIGGGSLCGHELKGAALCLRTADPTQQHRLERRLTGASPLPIIARSGGDELILDMRTITDERELYELAQLMIYHLKRVQAQGKSKAKGA